MWPDGADLTAERRRCGSRSAKSAIRAESFVKCGRICHTVPNPRTPRILKATPPNRASSRSPLPNGADLCPTRARDRSPPNSLLPADPTMSRAALCPLFAHDPGNHGAWNAHDAPDRNGPGERRRDQESLPRHTHTGNRI